MTGEPYTLVDMGNITPEIVISLVGLVLVTVLTYFNVRGAFCITLCFGTVVWWTHMRDWPDYVTNFNPTFSGYSGYKQEQSGSSNMILILELLFSLPPLLLYHQTFFQVQYPK